MLRVLSARTVVVLLLAIVACQSQQEPSRMQEPQPKAPIAEVLERHSPRLMAIEGIAGTYESRTPDGEPCIKVMIAQDSAELRARIPESLEGYPVIVVPTGPIAPRDNP